MKDSLQNKIIGYTKDKILVHNTYPIYEKKISNQWMDQTIKLGKNVFEQDLITYNSYSVVIGSEKDGWFKRKQFAEITNLNPSSSTEAMKVYQKKPVPSIFWTGLKYGGLGLAIGVLIKSL